MMNNLLERAHELKQELVDFVYDAEGELAVALERFSKTQLETWGKVQTQNQNHSALAIDMFLSDGRVDGKTPIDCFVEERQDLSAGDRQLLTSWKRTFNGLFEVIQVTDTDYILMNWLTAKIYRVQSHGLQDEAKLVRLKPGEMLLTRLAPLTEQRWIFSGPMELLGKLGKPKLAVAIGNFKDRFKGHLYGDAPELLEESWKSVETYHQEFVDFFGASEITLSGSDFNQRLREFQAIVSEKQLQQAGIDSSKSIQELAAESGISQEEMDEMIADLDDNSMIAKQLLNSGKSIKMVMPKVDLPKPLQRAETLTVIVHPRWGNCFLEDYQLLCDRLQRLTTQNSVTQNSVTQNSTTQNSANPANLDSTETNSTETNSTETEQLDRQIKRYLEVASIHPYVWQKLAEQYPEALAAVLRRVLQKPDFNLQTDLQSTLQTYGKPATPELPETASVPMHLNDLFQDALAAVEQPKGRSKSKKKAKAKAKTGFGAR